MIKKALILISVILVFQVVSSCFITNTCSEPATYEIIYNGVEIAAFNTSGFNAQPVSDTVYKNAFGIGIYTNSEYNQVSFNAFHNLSLFSQAWALSCESDNYIYVDPIKNAKLFYIDTKTQEKTNASTLFGFHDYLNDVITLEDFFNQREEWHDGFQFELIDFDSIPNSVIFTVELELKSGIIFMAETEVIHFY